MNLKEALNSLPETDKKVVVTHSGGMDSSTAVILASHKYGAENVISVGYNYGQKQSLELTKAAELCAELGVERHVLDLGILGDIVRNVSANISGTGVAMPTIRDVLGNPQPPTYVPFRNLVIFSLTASFAEANAASYIICGLQATDQYGYWDTTRRFVDSVNNIYSQNRSWPLTLIAPFNTLTKAQEISILQELDKLYLLEKTLSCYDPNEAGESCGKCPTCAERIKAFMESGIPDPVKYQIQIPWR